MEHDTMSYVQLVYRVLKNWYVKLAEFTPNLIVGLLVFLFFLTTSSYLSKVSVKIFKKIFKRQDNPGTLVILIGVFRFLIMIMGTFISLEIMGLSGFFVKFIGSLGVAGVIAGVALKDLVSSIFSGMLVGIDKSFKVGDYINIGNYSGTVQDIGFLTTKLITDDGRKVYIPNQVIFNAPFYNVTASPQRKIIIDLQIPADEDIELAKNSILALIKKLDYSDKTDTADVLITNLTDGTFTLQVKFWIAIGESIVTAKSNAYLQIKKTLDENKIALVTPTNISIEKNV